MEYITIGCITSARGIKGEVKVVISTDFPERFDPGNTITVACKEKKSFRIQHRQDHKRCVILKLEGVDTRNDAELLKGTEIVIREDELIELGENEFYLFELIGLCVIGDDGCELGKISEVLQGGANDVYVTDKGICIPALKTVVKKVDTKNGIMTINVPEGLLKDAD